MACALAGAPACARSLLVIVFTGLAVVIGQVRAGDWPQILGPHRDGQALDERLADQWPSDGPATLWQRQVGRGYAGVAVSGGRVVLFHRVDDESVAEALDAKTGKPLWKAAFPTRYVSNIAPDDGPRCVPLIGGDAVYLMGAGGDLHCLSLDSGAERWSFDCQAELTLPQSYFGAGSTPILDSGKLLVNVGAKDGAGLVAFAPADGKILWKATDEEASYSSPTATTQDGVRHVIFVTRLNVVSVDPDNGKERFRFPFGMRGPTVNAANPLVIDGHVFVTSNYGVGARLAKIGKTDARQIWESDDAISSQYTTCVEHAGYFYGIDGRQDQGVARLRCLAPLTQEVMWTKEVFGTGTLILADGKLVITKTDGQLVLATPSPKGYRELASAKIFRTTVQALPALSGGLLFVRDTHTLKCLRVGK